MKPTSKSTFGILGESPAIQTVIRQIEQVAPTDISVLLQGESGVGKDVTAKAIHSQSQRKDGPLVIVNCGAIPEGIIESELFGHEKGAFTGAHEARLGYFEKANGGTIFLDEIGDTPKNVQVKLLRVLETGDFFRVGSSKASQSDVRVIAASHRDLWTMVGEGTFREDLYYRLDTVKIKLPALRERTEDILPLFRTFASEFAAKYDMSFRGFTDDAEELLLSYRWPGNIRELKNVAEQLIVLEKSQTVDKVRLQKYLKGRQHLGSTDHLPSVHATEQQHRHQDGHQHAGRQHSGYQHAGHQQDGYQGDNFHSGRTDHASEFQFLLKAMLDVRTEIADLKRMMANWFMGSWSQPQSTYTPALPAPQSHPVDPNDLTSHLRPSDRPSTNREGETGDDPTQYSPTQYDPTQYDPTQQHPHIESPTLGSGGDNDDGSTKQNALKKGDTTTQSSTHNIKTPMEYLRSAAWTEGDFPSLEALERTIIERALETFEGNRRKASTALGISERTLYRKIDQYGLDS
ncbi:MAG: sigma 54-interacting transcriptional regulator [Balneolaceae bacterium]|nr:sigma 54-interacting transcriptional regulator [Balneolaceae bacterium]